ncbi:hypothetical protein, partial [Nocardiopsis sp. NRRL B-16309]|uniref:hypothetical protein n=1 Tax=Nocardiopsis sp. NRRL B-16309 TaxID=1519494 RepID=UPI0006C6D898
TQTQPTRDEASYEWALDWLMDWLTEAYHHELHAMDESCEMLALLAAGLMHQHQGKALQPTPLNTSRPAPTGQRRTPSEVAVVTASLAQLAGMDPVDLLRDAMGAYTGILAEDRCIF